MHQFSTDVAFLYLMRYYVKAVVSEDEYKKAIIIQYDSFYISTFFQKYKRIFFKYPDILNSFF